MSILPIRPEWMTKGWKAKNRDGRMYYDPRDEAKWFASKGIDGFVAVPVHLLEALGVLRECSDRRDFDHDEDGPTSFTTHAVCRKPEGHDGHHTNGYFTWEADLPAQPPQDWRDLLERVTKANENLELMAWECRESDPEESKRLQAKASGVRLILSYMEEYHR